MPDRSVALVSWLGRGYLRLVSATSRFLVEGTENLDEARKKQGPVLWAVWHNRLLGSVVQHGGSRIGVVISQSRDGELISGVVEGLGYVPLRGSSTRGGASALRAVIRHLRKGDDVAFTPDGPRGPRYTVHPGIVYVACRTGYPVIPLGVGMSRKLVFRSWDRFQVPLPFGSVQVVYGGPLWFGPGEPETRVAEAIRSALEAANQQADGRLGVRSP